MALGMEVGKGGLGLFGECGGGGDIQSLWTSPVVTVSREGQEGEGQRQVALE